MAKSTIFFLATVLCIFLCIISFAYGEDAPELFHVEGIVYCDTCNVQFLTKLSEPMEGATVRLVCTDEEDPTNVTLTEETTTLKDGKYNFKVKGDHSEELCEVKPVKSSREDCAEWDEKNHLQQSVKLSITHRNGIQSKVRAANALGFLKREPLPECDKVLKELGLNPDGSESDSASK